LNIGLRYWLTQAGAWGATREQCVAMYQSLVDAYCSKYRHYHDLTHIEYMFDLASEVEDLIDNNRAFYFAVWFHDAIQKLGRDSEALSSELAAKQLSRLQAPKELVNQVQKLILATKHSKSRSVKGDAALLVDIDLAILGSQPEQYSKYANNCRKEYKIPEAIYRLARQSVLKQFLSQTHIFHTEVFRKQFEQQAWNNIGQELERYYA